MMSSRLLPALACLCCGISHAASPQSFEAVEPHMGTLFRIKLFASSEVQAQKAFRAAFDRVAELDRTLSDYQPQSELSRLTRDSVQKPVAIGNDLFNVLQAAQALATETDGAFDPTLGPLTHLWRECRKTGKFPEPADLQASLAKCGFHKLRMDAATHSAMVIEPGMQLDLGGIAKGYAADEALAVLSHAGIAQALVAASGDLAFSDPPPGKKGWTIGIDSLDGSGQPFTKVLLLSNAAVSTSGDNEQHMDKGGLRYSHVIDPRTGLGLTNRLTVTVLARRGLEADALTKVICVWGQQRGLAFVERRHGVKALVVDRSVSPVAMSGELAAEGNEDE